MGRGNVSNLVDLNEVRRLREQDIAEQDRSLLPLMYQYLAQLSVKNADLWASLEQADAGRCGELEESDHRPHGCGRTADRWHYGQLKLCRDCVNQRLPHRPKTDG